MSSDNEPRFTEPLQASYLIREGQPVKLSCRFESSPKGEIQWLKDGIPIDFEALGISRDFTVVKDVDYTALLIKEAFPEDTGSYTVVIRNSIGEARSFTQLTVEEFFCRTPPPESEMSDTSTKPIFIQTLTDATLVEGTQLKLRAAITAHPEPEIIWYRNDIPLKNSRDLTLTFDGKLCILKKDRCEKENDTGIYRLTAVNSMGQAESKCQVIVQAPDSPLFRNNLQSTRQLPSYSQTIQQEEKHVVFQTPQVNQPTITPNYQIQTSKSNNVYQTKAMNIENVSQSSSFVNPLPKITVPEPMIIDSNGFGRPPEFFQLFKDRQTTLGSTVKFEARLTGTPPLTVYWLFNGSPINRFRANQHYQENVFNDTYTLTIYNIRYDDVGKYTLNAENSWGKATCTAELLIPPTVTKFGIDNSQTMLSNLLVKLSPSPPTTRKRQMETYEQQTSASSSLSLGMNTTSQQESSFISSTNNLNKRIRPIQSQSLTRHENYRHVRQQPKTLEIFVPTNRTAREEERQRIYTRSYEVEKKRSSSENLRTIQQPTRNDFEIEREYRRCLDDLTNEYEKLQQQKRPSNKPKDKTTYETTESFESIEQIYRHQPQIHTENTYQRSSSEGIIHRRLKPLSTYDVTLSDNDLTRTEFRLHHKERSQPIRIHSSSSSIPGETSIKYVRTERAPVELVVPKPQIYTTQGEHSSTIVKDVRRQSRKITTNIHQQPRRRTIEGQHELRIIEQPIASEQTRPVEFTVPKPIPTEHSSTFVVKSKKGGRFHTLDINSSSLERERIISGEHELRVIPEPIRSNTRKTVELLFPKPTFSSTTSSSHSSTVVKQNRTPKSSVLFDNIQTTLKGEHALRLIDRPIQSGPNDSVELIVPKSVTDTVEHTTTVVTETQPHRRVLEITGSGKKMTSEHERKYYQEKVCVEEEIEVKLPKPKYEQVEHSSTIVKHSRGKGPIVEIDTSQRIIQGEHETKFYEDSIETQVDAMQLLVAKPKLPAEHSTTIVKGQRGPTQRIAIDYTRPIPGEHETKHHYQPIESYSEMEVVFQKPQINQNEHTSTLVQKVHSKQVMYNDQIREIPGEHTLTFVDRSNRQIDRGTDSEIEFIVPKQQIKTLNNNYQSTNEYDERYASSTYEYEEDKSFGEHTTTYLKQARPKYEPVELVVDRPRQLPSVSKLIADIQPETQVTSIKPTRLHLIEDSSVQLDLNLNENNRREQYDEMEIVLEKPLVRDSSSTVLASIQPGLELKSFQPTTRQTIEESSSTFTYQREQQRDNDILELRLRKPYIEDSTTTILADVQSELNIQGPLKPTPYIQQTIEESTSTLTMDLNKPQQTKPFELIIPRIDQETSTNTILAQVAPTLSGLRAKLDIPSIEKSTSSFLLEQKKRLDEEVEIVMPKPKRFETSSTTMHADVNARLETKDIRPSQIQPETSTSAFYFEETTNYVIPEAVEIRMKQPTIADSSTTLFANVKPTIDTQYVQRLGQTNQSLERSSSEIIYETRREQIQPSEVELILPRPQIQESTSVMLADIRPTLDTSQTHVVIPPPLQSPIKSSSQFILEEDTVEITPVELYFHRQPSSHTLLTNLDETHIKNKETYVLGTNYQQDQSYGSSVIHADLNKPFELVFDVDGGNTSSVSQQYRRDYRTTTGGIDNSSTLITELQPVEFLVSGNNLGGYSSTTTEQYSTSPSGYSTRTTTTTTKRKITSVDTGNETNRSVTRSIRPYDQVEFVLQPDNSISSTSQVLTSYNEHSPYFTITLHDQTVRESDSILFEVTVSANPSAEIIWDKDGQPIGADSPFRIDYYGDGRTTLHIPEVFLDDQGYYTCTATNSLGTCRTTAYLTVNTTGDSLSSKRRQLTSSTTYTYNQGPTQHIESYRITSQPTTVSQITEETEIYRIPSQYQQNEITYSIHGTQQKFQPVQFLVTADQERTQPSYRDDTVTTTRYTQQSQTTSELNFTKPLEPINAREGGTIQITVHLSTFGSHGTRPKIQWYHHGQLIVPDNQHYRLTEDYDTVTLEIINVTKFDTGTVWCTATTPSGTATTTCSITVEERPVRRSHKKTTTTTTTSTSQYQVVPEDTTYTTETSQTQYSLRQPRQPDRHVTSEYYTTSQQNYPRTHTTQETDYTTQTQFSLHKPKQPDQHIITEYYTNQQEISPQTYSVQTRPHYEDYNAEAHFTLNQPKQPDHRITSSYYTTEQSTYPQSYTTQETDYMTQAQFALHKPKPQVGTTSEYTTVTEEQQAPLSYNFQVKTQPKDQPSEDVYGQFTLRQPKQSDQDVSATFNIKQQPQSSPQAYASITAEQQLTPKQPLSNIPEAPPLLPNFNIRPNYSDSQVKILNNGLQDQPLYPGSETVFECQFSGRPDKVQWFRNDVEIINTPQQVNNRIYHITNPHTGTTRLIIKPTLEEDVGTYTVKVTGPTGEEITSSKLIPALQFQNLQKKKTEQTQRKALVQELEEKQAKRMRPSKTAVPRGSFTSYATSDDDVFFDATQRNAAPTSHRQPTAPTVTRPLKDLDVKEGQPIQLTCQVQGFPKSELLWFKNNVPLPLSARHKTAYDAGSGTITLRINDARPEDSGVYTLVARNPQGHVQVSAQVDVRETPGIDETSYVQPDAFKYIEKQPIAPRPSKPTRRESDTTNLQQKPAKILKTPMSTSVVEGSTATFTCQVEGSPKPKVAWLKDNKPLMSGARFSTYFDQASKTAVLRINDISKDDQGYYTCVVDNPLNSDRSTATLQVVPQTKVD